MLNNLRVSLIPAFQTMCKKLRKALYSLKQAYRAWYERLTEFLVNNGYMKDGTNKTLFVKGEYGRLMIAQIYVDDIMFGGMSNQMVDKSIISVF